MKKPQAKKATKAKQREQRKKQREEKAKLKQQTKAATKLPKVIQTYDANSHKVDRDYIVEMLEANPSWVPKLASVIRQGGMKILMDIEKADCENNAPQVDFGEKWKGKNVRTLLGMPINVLISMVMSTLPEDAEEPLRDDEWWQAAFCYQMHCTKDTPLARRQDEPLHHRHGRVCTSEGCCHREQIDSLEEALEGYADG